jgi:heptosyltransferase I
MYTAGKYAYNILIIRLGAMGDIVHTLPAAAALKRVFPNAHITWIVERRWASLLEDNPALDEVALLERDSLAGIFGAWRFLRSRRWDIAVDFQGLLKSALVASVAHPDRIFGFHHSEIRERSAGIFYSDKVHSAAVHMVDRNLDLAAAAYRAPVDPSAPRVFPLPAGRPEGKLPSGDFVLASPLAGWGSKQWPLEHFQALAALLARDFHVPLVLNLPPGASIDPGPCLAHYSGIPGLIYATRRAAAVVGVDSGPLHIAAALSKPGVAIFGPTDPARNGPYGGSLHVLRAPSAATTYKRRAAIDRSMRAVSPAQVFEGLGAVCPCFRNPTPTR